MKKRGISLIILVITIIVLVIIAGAVIIAIPKNVSDAKAVKYIDDLTQIQDSVRTYYFLNNEYPTLLGTSAMNKNEILKEVKDANKLSEEIDSNNDTNSSFYKIDMGKIEINNPQIGVGKTVDDYFVISDSLNIYYLAGSEINGEMYYSLTTKLTKFKKVATNDIQDDSYVNVSFVDGVITNRKNTGWSNKLGINIKANLKENEKLLLEFSNITERKELVANGDISFDYLNELNSKNMLTSPISESEIASFNSAEVKYINVIKKEGTNEVFNKKIDIKNYDVVSPILESSNVNMYDNFNVVSLNVKDELSGVDTVRYDYLSRKQDEQITNYYNSNIDFSDEYMLTKAKIINVESDRVDIKIPKDIVSLKVSIIDKAGNMTSIVVNI